MSDEKPRLWHVAAQPGFFLLEFFGRDENGKPNWLRTPVVAWEIEESGFRLESGKMSYSRIVAPLGVDFMDSKSPHILCPDGTIVETATMNWDSLAHWLEYQVAIWDEEMVSRTEPRLPDDALKEP